MSTPLAMPAVHAPIRRPGLRAITIAALAISALTFLFDLLRIGPDVISVSHLIILSITIAVASLPFRWAPAVGGLIGGVTLLEGAIFANRILTQPDSTASFASIAVFFAASLVALVAGAGATIQGYRAPLSRPLVALPAPSWANPAMLALATFTLGAILTTAIQPRGAMTGLDAEALAGLPPLAARDFAFSQSTITARVGETVMLRLDNADDTAHYLDIDEFNVHALMPPGESGLAIFTPTQPGTYTFYCQPHADKAAGTGMVGTLVVEP